MSGHLPAQPASTSPARDDLRRNAYTTLAAMGVDAEDQSSSRRTDICRQATFSWRTLLEIDAKRPARDGHAAWTHLIQRMQHPSAAPQRLVGKGDDHAVGGRDRRGCANLSRN